MNQSITQFKDGTKQVFVNFITRIAPSFFLSLVLFIGGIALIALRIPGWSLLWGLIILPIGFAFTIYTLDDVARNVVAPPPFKPVRCNVCGKITYAREGDKDVICNRCREDITEAILKEKTGK